MCIRDSNKGVMLKPLLQALFEQLYEFGFRNFIFVVGRGKRAIEDHFTPDWDFVRRLNSKGKNKLAASLERFYKMIEGSSIAFVNQPEPRGFGHAVLMARHFIEGEPFLVCAGDTYIISEGGNFFKRMINEFKEDVSAVLLLQTVVDPRQYGVAIVQRLEGRNLVTRVIEKPEEPPSNYAIMPFYIFRPEIMRILEKLKPGVGGEIQLTDAIQTLIDQGQKVVGEFLRDDEVRLDIGTPETYWEALKLSYNYAIREDTSRK